MFPGWNDSNVGNALYYTDNVTARFHGTVVNIIKYFMARHPIWKSQYFQEYNANGYKWEEGEPKLLDGPVQWCKKVR